MLPSSSGCDFALSEAYLKRLHLSAEWGEVDRLQKTTVGEGEIKDSGR